MKVIVAGAGPGAADLYTDKMIQAVRSADLVLTAGRLYDSLSALTDKVQVMGVMDTVSWERTYNHMCCSFRRYGILQHCIHHSKKCKTRN